MTLREQVLKSMDLYGIIGQQGYPTEHNGGIDGGDSINRMGHYHFLIEANKKIGNDIAERENLPSRTYCDYDEQLNLFECKNSKGNYRRHPEQTRFGIAYYCNGTYDGVMSRDQSIPLVISLIVMGMYKRLFLYFLRHLMRGLLFTTNTRKNDVVLNKKKLPDFTGPEFLGLYIRSNSITAILLYPLLCIFDLETLIGSLIRRYQTIEQSDDVINHLAICIFQAQNYPTPISYMALKLNKYDDMLKKLKYYCGASEENKWRKIPFYVDLYEPLMAKYIK